MVLRETDFLGRSGGDRRAARRHYGGQQLAFMCGITADHLDQIRHKILAAAQLNVDAAEGLLHFVPGAHEQVEGIDDP